MKCDIYGWNNILLGKNGIYYIKFINVFIKFFEVYRKFVLNINFFCICEIDKGILWWILMENCLRGNWMYFIVKYIEIYNWVWNL